MYRIQEYLDAEGKSPFAEWVSSLTFTNRARIAARLSRFETGNLGDVKSVGKGVYEARIHFGPGYRIYFGIVAGKLVLLLTGGSKKQQSRDIRTAQTYWADWKEQN